jgi:signal transduction histidine kinase
LDRLEHVLRRWLGSWPAAFLTATVACGATIDVPTAPRMTLTAVAAIWAVVALVLDPRRRAPLQRGLAGAATLALLLAIWLAGSVWHIVGLDVDAWEQRALATLESDEPRAVAALESLRATAEERARLALDPEADIEELARPVPFAGTELNCGVSLWVDGAIVDWAGEVPGPDRLGQSGIPLVVDHGYRRVLSLRVDGVDGRVAYCDVALGVLGGLLPDSGLRPGPGEPLSESLGVQVEVWPRPPLVSAEDSSVRVVGVGEPQPWAWIELRANLPRLVRAEALTASAARAAAVLFLAMLPALFLLLHDWPHRWPDRGRAGRVLVVLLALVVSRISVERFGLLDRIGDAREGALGLLLEPSVFYLPGRFGLAHTAADFLLTALVIAAVFELLFTAWTHLVARTGSARWLGWLLLTVTGPAIVLAGGEIQQIVAEASLPVLLGVDSAFFTLPFLALHLAMLALLAGPVGWCVLGWHRWSSCGGRATFGALLAAGTALAGLMLLTAAGPVEAVAAALLPVIGRSLHRTMESEHFAQRALAALVVILWIAGFQSVGLDRVYSSIKEEVAVQEAQKRLVPEESNLAFLVGDIVQGWARDPELLAQLADPTQDRTNLAFELWARTFLPVQREGCRLELRARDGRTISEFDISLPYEPTPTRVWRQNAPRNDEVWSVETIELNTEQGPFLVYRGQVDLIQLLPESDLAQLVIDLPFAAAAGTEPLDRAPLSGPQILGLELGEPRLMPRKTFDRAVLIGHLDEEEVVSATEAALIGLPRSSLPPAGTWETRRIDGQAYRMGMVERQGRELLVALARPDEVERVLDFSRLAALQLFFVVLVVLCVLGVRALHLLPGPVWPASFGHAGFQERLLLAMLFVVLAPVLILGVFQQRRANDQLREDNLAEVSERLEIALQLLARNLDDHATALIDGEYVQAVLRSGELPPRRDLGSFELSQIMIFGPDGVLLLDETLRDLDDDEARAYLEQVRGGELMLEFDGMRWFLGRAYPVYGADFLTRFVYVRRQLADEDLGRVARMVSADLSLYDGPWAALSSQAYLFKAGLRMPALPRSGQPVLRGAARRIVDARASGRLVIAHGYAGIDGPGQPHRGVLEARLLGYATEAAREQRRAALFFFGLSSLGLVLATIVGFVFSGRITGPLRGLLMATERIGRGDLEATVPEGGSDEVATLVQSFNRMTRELRQSREELASRQTFLQDMLDAMSAGVLVVGADAVVVEANPAADELLGERRDAFLERIGAGHLGPQVKETEISLSRPDGPRTLRAVITPTALPGGASGWLVVFDDVTELLASRRLTLYAQMARQVAHEVKNPLTPIQLSAQMIRQAFADHHPQVETIVDDNVEQIERQVARLRVIASEFSLLGREQLPDVARIDLAGLLQEVRSQYPSLDGTFSVAVEAAQQLPVQASRNALTKVLTNLVENARQAMGEAGTVVLRGFLDGERVVVEVLDEGPGIAGEVENRLFEPYFSTKSTGTGLGLVICRNLMEKMGGSIAIANRPDATGAVARLTLPRSGSGNETPPVA